MLQEIKNYLSITWNDTDIDTKLEKMIVESKKAISGLMGIDIDFDNDEEMKELLKNRVRYAYNNSLEFFEENFHDVILKLQLKVGVSKL